MKKKLFIALIMTVFASKAVACDVCGCSLGGNYFGILPLYNKSFVSLRWSQAKFHSYIAPTQYLSAQESNDTYSKVELWGRYYLTKRIQLFAFIPFVYNTMNGTDQTVSTQGFGDISFLSNYVILNTSEEKRDFKHTLMSGGGVKLPTGEYSQTDKGKIINRNFQAGTGSVDFLVNAIYTLRYRKVGANVETSYKINTHNSHDYLFGNQFRASAQLFVWQKVGQLSVLPHGGISFEQAAMHKDGDIIQVNTGGTAWLASAGLDIYLKQYTLGFNYQTPVSQNYNSDEAADITSKARWNASFIFNF